jgi:hypothetical protein
MKVSVTVSSVAVKVPVPVDIVAGTSFAPFIVALKVTRFELAPVTTPVVLLAPLHAPAVITNIAMTTLIPRFRVGPASGVVIDDLNEL